MEGGRGMKKVEYGNAPSILLESECLDNLKVAISKKDGGRCIYNYPEVKRILLEDVFKGKCGYCESDIRATGSQIEHYRPKANVFFEPLHKGYYWLGSEWTNLLISCTNCNKRGAKGNHFPISGKRIFEDNPFDEAGNLQHERTHIKGEFLPNELPLLLHPIEIENINDHFVFLPNGMFDESNCSERGRKTIEICKLNRKGLYEMREEKLLIFLEEIQEIIREVENDEIQTKKELQKRLFSVFRKIKNSGENTSDYSAWGQYMYAHFEECFVSRLYYCYQYTIRAVFNTFILSFQI
jgi:uncharacterized protein (TIGR02646 family)